MVKNIHFSNILSLGLGLSLAGSFVPVNENNHPSTYWNSNVNVLLSVNIAKITVRPCV